MKLLTAAEACDRLRIKDPKTLYKLIRSGELPAMRPSPRAPYLISEKALNEFVARKSVRPEAVS